MDVQVYTGPYLVTVGKKCRELEKNTKTAKTVIRKAQKGDCTTVDKSPTRGFPKEAAECLEQGEGVDY